MCRYQRPELPRVEAPTAAPPIVLLPGFGNCTQDYVAPFGDEEAGVAAVLQVRRSAGQSREAVPAVMQHAGGSLLRLLTCKCAGLFTPCNRWA